MKKVFSILIILIMAFSLVSCGSKPSNTTSQSGDKAEPEGPVIGFSIDSFLIERWQRDSDVFVAKVKECDPEAEVYIQNANGDLETQKEQIRYLISKKVDVLVVICIDSDKLSDVVTEAKSAGIPVIAYDRLINNADVDLYISFDNEKVGELMGQALVDSGLPNKKVLMLSGAEEDHNVSMVDAGFKRIMEENDIEIVDTFHASGWRAEAASEYLNENFDILTDVDAIMCGNDNIATSVIRTLSERRLAGKIKIVEQDADLEGCQRVVEGTQVMTVYKPVEKLAQSAAEYAVRLAKGEDLSEVQDELDDGTYQVPYVYLTPIAVTKDNIDETIIDSGFHLRDEVYLNVVD